MKHLLALVLMLLPLTVRAEGSFPALYDVTGVAGNDVLNVRTNTTAASPIIGMLLPTATDVEVIRLSENGRWGLVNTGEAAGWASMHFLARQPGQTWGAIPANLVCFGNEPFWSLRFEASNSGEFATPEMSTPIIITDRLPGVARRDRFAILAEGSEGAVTAIVGNRACNDGMSELKYGLDIDVLMEPGVLYSGCCSLER